MEHNFNVDIATRYGIEEAILLQHIYYWIEKNKANNKHFHDGKYWTYNSARAFHELFPYIQERTIARKLDNLINNDLLLCADYNENRQDRVSWYALTEKAEKILNNPKLAFDKMTNALDNLSNGIRQNDKSSSNIDIINNIDTNIKQTNIIEKENLKRKNDSEILLSDKEKIILDKWNSYNIHKCIKITSNVKNAISKSIKMNSETDILKSIEHYDEILKSQYYFSYKWDIIDFLNRKNALPDFMDNGKKWLAYQDWLKNNSSKVLTNKANNVIIQNKDANNMYKNTNMISLE